MGNLISNENGILNENELSRQIILWANNNYNEGNNIPTFNNLLKKRACCTKQTNVYIPILAYNNFFKKYDLTSINIPVFNSINDITQENCKFEKKQGSSGILEDSIYFNQELVGSMILSNSNCNILYTPFCRQVYNENIISFGQMYGYYGPYLDKSPDDNPSKLNLANSYIDCNCENSVFKKQAIIIQENTDNKTILKTIDSNTAAQNLDERCATNLNKTFNILDSRKDVLCVNNINIIGEVSVQDKANIKFEQKCQAEKNINGSPTNGLNQDQIKKLIEEALVKKTTLSPIVKTTPASIVKTTPASIVKTTTSRSEIKRTTNNTGIIIGSIIGVIIVIIIILIFIIIKRKKRASYTLPTLSNNLK